MAKLKNPQVCPKCGGRGTVISGVEARNMRVSRRLTLAQVSKKMGISLPYLANLEQGIKDFNYELEDKFRLALK